MTTNKEIKELGEDNDQGIRVATATLDDERYLCYFNPVETCKVYGAVEV